MTSYHIEDIDNYHIHKLEEINKIENQDYKTLKLLQYLNYLTRSVLENVKYILDDTSCIISGISKGPGKYNHQHQEEYSMKLEKYSAEIKSLIDKTQESVHIMKLDEFQEIPMGLNEFKEIHMELKRCEINIDNEEPPEPMNYDDEVSETVIELELSPNDKKFCNIM